MKNKKKILITPKKNPDLDGTACAFGYAEFLRKNGKDAVAAVFGEPHREAQFVINKFKIPALENADKVIDSVHRVVIVDASSLRGLSEKIDPNKVVEIIDHRQLHESDKFPNAKAQIELVGSAATLIAEKFHNNKTEISMEAAVLLFSAIVSNTINFQNSVTTDRDREMADWLKAKFSAPDNYIHEMFVDKSRFEKSLKDTMLDDFATFCFHGRHIGFAQLELVDVEEFIKKNLFEIKKTLQCLKAEKAVELILLSCIDVENSFNRFVVIDEESRRLLEHSLSIKFDENGVARYDNIIMRKELAPLIKKTLEADNGFS